MVITWWEDVAREIVETLSFGPGRCFLYLDLDWDWVVQGVFDLDVQGVHLKVWHWVARKFFRCLGDV